MWKMKHVGSIGTVVVGWRMLQMRTMYMENLNKACSQRSQISALSVRYMKYWLAP